MRCVLLVVLFISTAVLNPAAPHGHLILIQGFQFQPDKLTVQVGDSVEWKNGDIVPHTVTASDGAFRSGLIQPKHSWKLVVQKPGTYSYSCTPHPNMKAVLTVEQTSVKRR